MGVSWVLFIQLFNVFDKQHTTPSAGVRLSLGGGDAVMSPEDRIRPHNNARSTVLWWTAIKHAQHWFCWAYLLIKYAVLMAKWEETTALSACRENDTGALYRYVWVLGHAPWTRKTLKRRPRGYTFSLCAGGASVGNPCQPLPASFLCYPHFLL